MLDRQLSLRTGIAVLAVALLGLAALAALLLGGDSTAPTKGSLAPGTVAPALAADYVGDAVCASCHPAAFRAHHASRHAATLHPMDAGQLPAPFPDHARFSDAATGTQYELVRRRDRYYFRVLGPAGPQEELVQYAFGSGKTGITLVSRAGEDAIRELRMSYFPHRGRWEVTPGQRGPTADPLGALHNGPAARRCFSCHAVLLSRSAPVPESHFLGVGCESCHGPGRRHLEALQRGDPTPHIDNPGRWDGLRINELCGRCHRSAQQLDPLDPLAFSQTQRFQPLGLARSACFRSSAGRLSCVTCHDAHENARTDVAHYERVCRFCHEGSSDARSNIPTRRSASNTQRASAARTCPVNPHSGCITCHMPDREVVRGIAMADHWIRVVRSSVRGSVAP